MGLQTYIIVAVYIATFSSKLYNLAVFSTIIFTRALQFSHIPSANLWTKVVFWPLLNNWCYHWVRDPNNIFVLNLHNWIVGKIPGHFRSNFGI